MSPRAAPAGQGTSVKAQTLDSMLSAVVALAGAALIWAAVRQSPRAFVLVAGLEGSVVILVLRAVLAMIGGLRARAMLALLAPIVVVAFLYMYSRSIPWLAPIGLELGGMGVAGLIGARLSSRTRGVAPEAQGATGDRITP